MKIQFILDVLGRNPAYDPPLKKDFASEEDWADAKALYDVPPDRLLPAGTIEAGPLAWIHCFPDQQGIAFKYNKEGKVVPYRKAPGVVRAVPFDDACKTEFLNRAKINAASRGVDLQVVLDEVAAGVERSKTIQAAADALKRSDSPVLAGAV